MIEYVKTIYGCGHVEYSGSTFGNAPEVAEANAREAGYLRTEQVEGQCPECNPTAATHSYSDLGGYEPYEVPFQVTYVETTNREYEITDIVQAKSKEAAKDKLLAQKSGVEILDAQQLHRFKPIHQ